MSTSVEDMNSLLASRPESSLDPVLCVNQVNAILEGKNDNDVWTEEMLSDKQNEIGMALRTSMYRTRLIDWLASCLERTQEKKNATIRTTFALQIIKSALCDRSREASLARAAIVSCTIEHPALKDALLASECIALHRHLLTDLLSTQCRGVCAATAHRELFMQVCQRYLDVLQKSNSHLNKSSEGESDKGTFIASVVASCDDLLNRCAYQPLLDDDQQWHADVDKCISRLIQLLFCCEDRWSSSVTGMLSVRLRLALVLVPSQALAICLLLLAGLQDHQEKGICLLMRQEVEWCVRKRHGFCPELMNVLRGEARNPIVPNAQMTRQLRGLTSALMPCPFGIYVDKKDSEPTERKEAMGPGLRVCMSAALACSCWPAWISLIVGVGVARLPLITCTGRFVCDWRGVAVAADMLGFPEDVMLCVLHRSVDRASVVCTAALEALLSWESIQGVDMWTHREDDPFLFARVVVAIMSAGVLLECRVRSTGNAASAPTKLLGRTVYTLIASVPLAVIAQNLPALVSAMSFSSETQGIPDFLRDAIQVLQTRLDILSR